MTSYFVPSPITAAQAANLDAAVSSRAPRQPAATFFGTVYAQVAGLGVPLDTGPLPAGEYGVIASAGTRSQGGTAQQFDFEHRNAANNGNVRAVNLVRPIGAAAGQFGAIPVFWPRITLAANERFRIAEEANQAADGTISAYLFVWAA